MLPLLFAGIVFTFLLLGSLVFIVCALVPWTREYALSAALWCAMWGPSSVVLMILAGAGVLTAALVTKSGDAWLLHAPRMVAAFGWTYLVAGALATLIVATASACVHQIVVKRLTLALFRLYSAAVSAGIGGVFGCCLGLWIMSKGLSGSAWFALWLLCMLALIAGIQRGGLQRREKPSRRGT